MEAETKRLLDEAEAHVRTHREDLGGHHGCALVARLSKALNEAELRAYSWRKALLVALHEIDAGPKSTAERPKSTSENLPSDPLVA